MTSDTTCQDETYVKPVLSRMSYSMVDLQVVKLHRFAQVTTKCTHRVASPRTVSWQNISCPTSATLSVDIHGLSDVYHCQLAKLSRDEIDSRDQKVANLPRSTPHWPSSSRYTELCLSSHNQPGVVKLWRGRRSGNLTAPTGIGGPENPRNDCHQIFRPSCNWGTTPISL